MSKSVDPDETAHDEPVHPDLHYLQISPYTSAGLKGLNSIMRIIYVKNEAGIHLQNLFLWCITCQI